MMQAPTLTYKKIAQMALPLILANLTVPLLGIANIAIIGHLHQQQYIAAIALGTMILDFVFIIFNFLRASTTGLTAQAFGRSDFSELRTIISQALIAATAIGLLLILFQPVIMMLALHVTQASPAVKQMTASYVRIAIFSAPAILGLYALIGWFIGTHNLRVPFWIVLITNITGISLGLLFVFVYGGRVIGLAWANLIAHTVGLGLSVLILFRLLPEYPCQWHWRNVFKLSGLATFFKLNIDFFIRTLCLVGVYTFFTVQGSRLSETILAANALLVNLHALMAYGLDGLANVAEALIGHAVGQKSYNTFKAAIKKTAVFSFLFALAISAIYLIAGNTVLSLMTNVAIVEQTAQHFLIWVVILPIVGVWSFLLDGVFIGATWSTAMRNNMVISTLIGFFPLWYFTQQLGNNGLWLSFTGFMIIRGITMGVSLSRGNRQLQKGWQHA